MSNRKTLDGGELLWRRVHGNHLLRSGKVSSAAFSDDEMSVDIASIQMHMSETLVDGVGVAEFDASTAQALGQDTFADPIPENPAHALVVGKKTKSIKRTLRDSAKFTPRDEIVEAGE